MDNQLQSMLYDTQKKSTGIAYLLFFLFGMLGVHRFYLGQKLQGFMRIFVFIGMISSLTVIGASAADSVMKNTTSAISSGQTTSAIISSLFILVGIILCFYDLFTLHSSVKKKNLLLIQKLSTNNLNV